MNWFIIAFFILSISLFLITHYYRLKQTISYEQIEAFETEETLSISQKLLKYHNITIKYLDTEQAKNLIIKIKNGEYINGMNQANLSARGCVSIDDLYNKYLNGFENITDDEKAKVEKFIYKLLNEIKAKTGTNAGAKADENAGTKYYNYVVKWLQTVSFAKAKSWLESGMPHTLETTIVMDAGWFSKPRKITLLHEMAHVHQRQSSFDFEDLYSALGYLYNPVDIRGMNAIYPLNRNNPDGTSKYWLWHLPNKKDTKDTKDTKDANNTYWWMGAIFKSVEPSSLTDVNLLALQLEHSDDGTFYYLKQNPTALNNLKEFANFFGDNPNNYHPNEMSAKFAEWYLEDVLRETDGNGNGNGNGNSILNENTYIYNKHEGYRIYKKYFENMINKYY